MSVPDNEKDNSLPPFNTMNDETKYDRLPTEQSNKSNHENSLAYKLNRKPTAKGNKKRDSNGNSVKKDSDDNIFNMDFKSISNKKDSGGEGYQQKKSAVN